MSDNHLSAFEQEEYLFGERTAEMLRHLAHCAQCQASVTHMEQDLAAFRSAAVAWSDGYLSTRSQPLPLAGKGRPWITPRWAIAGVMPIILLLLAWVAFHTVEQQPIRPVAAISDDALLDQVDAQVSVAVPASMESLTHLVSADNDQPAGAQVRRSEPLVQTN